MKEWSSKSSPLKALVVRHTLAPGWFCSEANGENCGIVVLSIYW
jgi:hypothetical protein